ncbi:MAG: hypothetical protein OXM54_06765 [Acidimicrobiaceae bacterium]|nr:hypothetical protein [Acidimicrobiaceae bacterium]
MSMGAEFSPHELVLEFGPPIATTRRFTPSDDGLLIFKRKWVNPLHGYAYFRDGWWNYVNVGTAELDVRFTVLINANTAILADAAPGFDDAEQLVRLGEYECRLAVYREWKRPGAKERCYVRLKGVRRVVGAQLPTASDG